MYSCIPSFMCVNFTYEFFSSYAFVVYLRKLLNQFCVVFSSVTKCMSLLLWFWTSFSYKLGIKKTMHGEILCRLGSIPIIMSTNHVKFVVFLPVVKLAFFFCDIFSTVYIWCILYTHLALNVGDTFVMSRLHDVCAKNSCRAKTYHFWNGLVNKA